MDTVIQPTAKKFIAKSVTIKLGNINLMYVLRETMKYCICTNNYSEFIVYPVIKRTFYSHKRIFKTYTNPTKLDFDVASIFTDKNL